jgi:hypothetical protein
VVARQRRRREPQVLEWDLKAFAVAAKGVPFCRQSLNALSKRLRGLGASFGLGFVAGDGGGRWGRLAGHDPIDSSRLFEEEPPPLFRGTTLDLLAASPSASDSTPLRPCPRLEMATAAPSADNPPPLIHRLLRAPPLPSGDAVAPLLPPPGWPTAGAGRSSCAGSCGRAPARRVAE